MSGRTLGQRLACYGLVHLLEAGDARGFLVSYIHGPVGRADVGEAEALLALLESIEQRGRKLTDV